MHLFVLYLIWGSENPGKLLGGWGGVENKSPQGMPASISALLTLFSKDSVTPD